MKGIQLCGRSRCHHLFLRRAVARISTRSHHKCDVWTEAAGRTLCPMDKITQLEILARAFLGGLVETPRAGARGARPRAGWPNELSTYSRFQE